MEEKKQYFNEINIMRGMAVLCVVVGHSFHATDNPTILGFIKSFVYCFHMPAFFFISGFLVKERQMDIGMKVSKIINKGKRLMVPYLFFTIVSILLKTVFGSFASNPLNYGTLVTDILTGRNNPNGGLWFLYALFIISAVGILLNHVDIRLMLASTFILYLFNCFVFHQSGQILGFFLEYAWYYFGGGFFRKYLYESARKTGALLSAYGKLIIGATAIVYIAIVYVRVYLVNLWLLSVLVTWGGILLLCFLAILTEVSNRKYMKNIWMLLGDYGMDIYMIGYYVQQVLYVFMGKMLKMDYLVYAWCMCIFGLIVPVFISKYIIRKNKVLSFLILGW